MLTVAKVTAGVAAGYAEYLKGKASGPELGDYYLKDGDMVQAPGRWAAGAEAVGQDRTRPVSGDQLRALMAVQRPDTGESLRPVGSTGEAVAGLDATFSAPKSVSAVWALAGSELRAQIEAAHETAIDRALAYAVAQVRMVRERVDRAHVIHVNASRVVATSWRHTTARAVDGQPPDPQLHSHVLLHAAVRRDGRTVAIDSRAWLVHRRELGAAYRTELASGLARLGFAIERGTGQGGRYFELAGVPQALLDRWSSRHREVRAAIEARLAGKRLARETAVGAEEQDGGARNGAVRLGAREERFMSYSTRTTKTLHTRRDLDRHWSTVARQIGVARHDAEDLRAHGGATESAAAEPAQLADALTEFDATFQSREARAVALERSAGASTAEALAVLVSLRERGELLQLADGTVTTRRHRARERQTVAAAARLADGRVDALPEAFVGHEADALDRRLRASGGRLAEEQHDAIVLGCGDRQVVIIEGQAGTGKSTVLSAIARAHQADGRTIVVTSTAGLAAQRLGGDLALADVAVAAYSTVALQRALASGRLDLGPDTTIIHDEAALASTGELYRLLGAVEASGARLIMVGDPRQSQPVGAGGLWAHLESVATEHDARVTLTRNVRALDRDDRRDQHRFRAGEYQQAVEGYARRDRMHLHHETSAAEDAALEAAQRDREAERRTLVITQTSNEHLDELNARAQAVRLEHGGLGERSLPIPGRPYALRAGDEVQLRATIHHDQLGVVRNGTTATITAIDDVANAAEVRLSDDRLARLNADQLEHGDVRLAYVQHPFPAQGHTADTTHLIVAERATREGSYVALTRARQRTDIYASQALTDSDTESEPLALIAEQLSRREPDLPSIATPLAHEQQIKEEHEHEREGRDEKRERAHGHPPRYATLALGARPADPDLAIVWDGAADAIESYRAAYDIDLTEASALGPEPSAGAFRQRHDRQQVVAELLYARAALGRPTDRSRSIELATRDVPGVIAAEPEPSLGWEP